MIPYAAQGKGYVVNVCITCDQYCVTCDHGTKHVSSIFITRDEDMYNM